jgi:hypothetical protein
MAIPSGMTTNVLDAGYDGCLGSRFASPLRLRPEKSWNLSKPGALRKPLT